MESIYEAIPEIQEAKGSDETSPENCYDDIVSLKFAKLPPNQLEDSNTLNKTNRTDQSRSVFSARKPNSAQPVSVTKSHNDLPTDKHPPTQPVMKSIHKRLLLRRRHPSHAAGTSKSQKPPILGPKPVTYHSTSATSYKATAGKHQMPPLPPKNIATINLAN